MWRNFSLEKHTFVDKSVVCRDTEFVSSDLKLIADIYGLLKSFWNIKRNWSYNVLLLFIAWKNCYLGKELACTIDFLAAHLDILN